MYLEKNYNRKAVFRFPGWPQGSFVTIPYRGSLPTLTLPPDARKPRLQAKAAGEPGVRDPHIGDLFRIPDKLTRMQPIFRILSYPPNPVLCIVYLIEDSITIKDMLAAILLLQAQLTIPSQRVSELLARLTEEAEMLRQNAPKALAEEVLEQRARRPPSRFRPRAGAIAIESPPPQFYTREIVSEYSVGVLKETESQRLMEFRQVVSVDGRPVQTRETARTALAMGLRSNEDRARKRMLEDYERHGLVGAVTDFGILLLQFTKRGIRDLTLAPAGVTTIGTDQVIVFTYQQTSGETGLLDFSKRRATRYPLTGKVFLRVRDGLPVRVTCSIRRIEDKHEYVDEGTVDYAMSAHGFVAPVSVVHRKFIDRQLNIENLFRYASFRTFGADTEIRFTEVPGSQKP